MRVDIYANGPVIRPLGDQALSVEFGDRIDAAVLSRVHAFDAAVNCAGLPGVSETIPTYRGVTLVLDPLVADLRVIMDAVQRLASAAAQPHLVGRLWEVPVVYGGAYGLDLDSLAAHAGLSARDVVDLHSAAVYTVAMVGFLPGFSYLSGLDPRLAMPRRSSPRAKIPASSISIGGVQTAIGSLEGPSGWHLIGRSPVRPYLQGRQPEFLFAPGDRIRFRPISAEAWEALDTQAAQGALIAERAAP